MSLIAPILEQAQGKIRFCVDEVEPTQAVLSVQTAKSQLEQQLRSSILAFSHDETFQVVQGNEIHPLALAAHTAFSQHRPLILTPDIVWMTIAQGFAQHINNHAEALRGCFVHHQDKKELVAECNRIPSSPQQWSEVIQNWGLQIRDHVGADLYRWFECNFSTTTSITRTASHIVMMDAFHQYFDYVCLCVCGIPDITLLGTVEDWQSVHDRVQHIAQYNLNWWTDRLLPICQEFIHTASGKPALEFWRCIYKPEAVYATEYMTGWLTDLFPYVQDPVTKAPTVQNQLLRMDRCELPRVGNTAKDEAPLHLFAPVRDGIPLNALPPGLSQVVFKLKAKEKNRQAYDLALVAGFIGVHQDTERGALHPEIGWAVQEYDNHFGKLLDRIQQEHMTQLPAQWSTIGPDTIPKELVQMLERFDGATLYPDGGHAWKITNVCSWKDYYEVSEELNYSLAYPFIDLEDGRCIAFAFNFRSDTCWLLLGKRDDELKDPIVIAKSIPELFERIFEAEGSYYFDDPNFTIS